MWITDWSQIEDFSLYIVAPIKTASEGDFYLGATMERARGWTVKNMRQGRFAALLCPAWDGKTPQVSSPS